MSLKIERIVIITNKETEEVTYELASYIKNYRSHLYNKYNTMEEVDRAYEDFNNKNEIEYSYALYDEENDNYFLLNQIYI